MNDGLLFPCTVARDAKSVKYRIVPSARNAAENVMPNPRPAAEWAKTHCKDDHVVDAWLMCPTCADAFARQQVEAALEKLANHSAKGFTGCVVCKYVSEAGHREDCLLAAMIRALRGTCGE